MATYRLSVEIKSRWWRHVDIRTWALFCMTMWYAQDYEKMASVILMYGISHLL